jgi:hypothetical protein
LYWDLLTNGWYQPACQILRVWVLGFGDVVVATFNDTIAAEQSTQFAACKLVLGVFCCMAVCCARKCLHRFLKSGFFTGFSYKFCKWRSPKAPLLLINLSRLSAFSASFCFVDCVARQEEEEEEDESLSVAAQDCDALVTSLRKFTMRAYCYVLAMLWYTW